MAASDINRRNVRNLLLYAQKILEMDERVISDLSKDSEMTVFERDIAGLEGVRFNAPNDSWINLARLAETPRPDMDPALDGWIEHQAGADPFDLPTLLDKRVVSRTREDINHLMEAGMISPDDVLSGDGGAKLKQWSCILRLERYPELQVVFDAYIAGRWKDWVAFEKPRRRSIKLYSDSYQIQQRTLAMGDDVPIECVIGVGMARWHTPKGKINIPLIEVPVELELDESDGTLSVRPRSQPPRLMLRAFEQMEIDAVGQLARDAEAKLLRLHDDPDIEFSPFKTESFIEVLRMCAARLSSSAIWEGDIPVEERAKKADGTLRISQDWVFYVRRRSIGARRDDIRKLVERVDAAADEQGIPATAIQLTATPHDRAVEEPLVDLWNSSLVLPEASRCDSVEPADFHSRKRSDAPNPDEAFFFPLPYNESQIEIARRLADDDVSGVVVQGPPGTGKTHTIANVVAHYMARGGRVLVTARSAEALSAVQSKLPQSIRDLAIAVVHSDREGARQLENAVNILSGEVKQIDLRAYNQRRIDAEQRLVKVREELDQTDGQIKACAEANLRLIRHEGQDVLPMDLATDVEAGRIRHEWFTDRPSLNAKSDSAVSAEDMEKAFLLRCALGRDIAYAAGRLPDPATLLDTAQILSLHDVFVREQELSDQSGVRNNLFLSLAKASEEQTATTARWLQDYNEWRAAVCEKDEWLYQVHLLLAGSRTEDKAVVDKIIDLVHEWVRLAEAFAAFRLQGIVLPPIGAAEPMFDAALDALSKGEKPFGLFSFGKTGTKSHIDAVRLTGRAPQSAEQWKVVADYRAWQANVDDFAGRWAAAAMALQLEGQSRLSSDEGTELSRAGRLVAAMLSLHRDLVPTISAVGLLFPQGIDSRRVVIHGENAQVLAALKLHLEKHANADAHKEVHRLEAIANTGGQAFYTALKDFCQALRSPVTSVRELATAWDEIVSEAVRLHALGPHREVLDAITQKVAAAGAPIWAEQLLRQAASADDPWLNGKWVSAWSWARAVAFIDRLPGRGDIGRLSDRRKELEDEQKRLMGEIVRIRTFIGLKQNITERVATALAQFALKVRQYGAGTGASATRHRRAIQEAATKAAEAVPCWILPEWRVAEQLPDTLGFFDLVIIDEASQSDITALPAIMRGKKLLIVGDDKQVSPTSIGLQERSVIELRETYLRDMPIANYLDPTTSIYDLVSMTFPGSTILLREHYRCVEPIIRFSSRFYPKSLIPLRVPTQSERLDPPLIDVYLPHGTRSRKESNQPEADYIVDEIARLVDDSAYAGRSMGVISLIGDKQAKLVQELLTERIGTEAIARHRIMCGNAATFQGQERDIMFLSMVACPQTARAQTARMFEQRFNVAMSRARDRMYLVRSVTAAQLPQNDLKLAIVEHFQNPMAGAAAPQSTDVLEMCDSGFEREVGQRLLARGYRVKPQVEVGGYRIDFVVEGDNDRRLAVELDGDKYHGPDRWLEDAYRQRALERMGWVFWRCWGSHWSANPEACFEDLLGRLQAMEIEPIGGDLSPYVYTEHRVITPPVSEDDLDIMTGGQTGLGKDSGHIDLAEAERIVEAGDIVLVRFADDNRVLRVQLSTTANDPGQGIVHITQPLALALLGNGIDEEVEVDIGTGSRTAIIEKIAKAA